MKTNKELFCSVIFFFMLSTVVIAQPAPPAPTDGAPIVGIMGGMGLFIVAAMGFALRKKISR